MQLNAIRKQGTGTGAARQTRRDGNVPGIIYAKNFQPLTVAIERKELIKAIHTPGFRTRLIELNLDGETHKVLARDVQFHPVTDVPEHVDFQRVSEKERIRVSVPVSFINSDKSPGLKRGGVLNIVRHEIEFYCTPANIPEKIVIDLSGARVGQSIHIENVPLAEGVKPVIDRNFTIATIAGAVTDKEESAEGEAAAAAPADAKAAPAAAKAAPAKKDEKKK